MCAPSSRDAAVMPALVPTHRSRCPIYDLTALCPVEPCVVLRGESSTIGYSCELYCQRYRQGPLQLYSLTALRRIHLNSNCVCDRYYRKFYFHLSSPLVASR